MSLTINESFRVNVPPERAWQFLIDPTQVVLCLPGAELTETVDACTYRGKVRVKVGPISTAYDGIATLTEVNDATHVMRMLGEGREVGSAGSAKMKMVGTVSAHAEGGSVFEVNATVDIAGRVMQFGRGLVESVSRQLFRQFADAVRRTLEQEPVATTVATAAVNANANANANANVAAETPIVKQNVSTPQPRELRIIPLLWRALLDWVRRLFVAT